MCLYKDRVTQGLPCPVSIGVGISLRLQCWIGSPGRNLVRSPGSSLGPPEPPRSCCHSATALYVPAVGVGLGQLNASLESFYTSPCPGLGVERAQILQEKSKRMEFSGKEQKNC